MDKKLTKRTDELIAELTADSTDFETYIAENSGSLIEINLIDFWGRMIKKSGLSNGNIINRSNYSYYYFYEVISGKKIPSRDKIVSLVLAMHLELEDCQTALKYCGKSALYPKLKRDSILIYAVSHGFSLAETNELLDKEGFQQLQ